MSNILSPIVVKLGKQKQKRIEQLTEGRGPLADEVQQTVEETIARLGPAAEGKTFVPIVVVYKKKEKKRGLSLFG